MSVENCLIKNVTKFTFVVAILLTKDTCLKPLSDKVTAISHLAPELSYTSFKGFPNSSSFPLI